MFPPEEAVRTIFFAMAGFTAVYWAVYWYRARKLKQRAERRRGLFNFCPICKKGNCYEDGYCDQHRELSPNPPVYVGLQQRDE